MPLIYPVTFLGGGGTIAFPTLRATSTYLDNTFQFSHNVTLPSGTTTGDLVVVCGYFAANLGGLTVDFVAPGGWTRFANQNFGTAAELNAYCTIASGPMSTVTLSRSGTTAAATARCNAYSFSAHSHTPSLMPAISSIVEQLSTANPDPPSLSVPGAWGGSPHATWIAGLYKFGDSTTSAAPSGYSNIIGTTDGQVRMVSARRNLQAATENPGAWTISAAHGGTVFTIAVRGPE